MSDDGSAPNSRFSLAHELAVALMPEPSAGSRLLAEEFGIEYDEGAEGIDPDNIIHTSSTVDDATSADDVPFADASFADEQQHLDIDSSFDQSFTGGGDPEYSDEPPPRTDPTFDGSPISSRRRSAHQKKPEKDPMQVLARNLQSTDKFLLHLRHIDSDSSQPQSQSQPALERLASDVIRRYNETARDREGQVRELLECEREFRKIAGEVGGGDVLGRLDELVEMEPEPEPALPSAAESSSRQRGRNGRSRRELSMLEEEAPHQEWEEEEDPDLHQHSEEDGEEASNSDSESSHSSVGSTNSNSLPPPSAPTPLAHLASLRTLTASLVTSMTRISEHAMVNGAATTDAGRRLRALKNKVGGWKGEWEGAERARVRIDKWEKGEGEFGSGGELNGNANGGGRIDGRTLVKEHLDAFELALADAGKKTKAIMAVS